MNPKKPIEIKKLEGTYRKDRDKGRLEVVKLDSIPETPEYLSEVAKDYFVNVCNTLLEYDLLSAADVLLVVQLSQALELQQTAYENIKDGQAVQLSPNKYQTVAGWFSVWEKTSKKIAELSNLFGLNPSAREKFNIQKKEEEIDELQLLLNRGKEKGKN